MGEPSASFVGALVRLLLEHQKEAAISNVQLAARLGVDAAHWLRVRDGRHGAGVRIVEGAARAFPELVTRALAGVGEQEGPPSGEAEGESAAAVAIG